jgi:DeoR/GlpR family transcriptional regulator of sugar metabolism
MIQTIEQRREAILAVAYQHGHVSVRQLGEQLGVSQATIRRDLQGLAAQGRLELTYGGARVISNSDYSFLSKSLRNVEAKKTIASLASQMVADADQIFLDSGTTCFQMTAFLRSKRSLSVIVNSMRTAQELHTPGTNVLIVGGQYRPDRMDTVGPMASESLDRLRGYTAFLGTDGISMDFGLTSVDIESAHLLGIAVRNANQSVLLADSTKFDKPALYKIIDFDEISAVVTEKRPSPQWVEFFRNKNVIVFYPSGSPASPQTGTADTGTQE